MKAFVFALFLLGCGTTCATVTPTPTPTPGPVDYVAICAHLLDIGCGEGAEPNCATTFQRIDQDRVTNLHLQCLLDAGDRAQARACGSVACE